jgi:hypothetical protein
VFRDGWAERAQQLATQEKPSFARRTAEGAVLRGVEIPNEP